MTSKASRGKDEYDFLVLAYPEMDFIINKLQFSTSIFVERELKIRSGVPYIRSVVQFGQTHLLLFDFEAYLRAAFRFKTNSEYHIALVSATAGYSDRNREIFDALRFGGSLRVSREAVAVKVGSQAEIQTVKLQELKAIPRNIRTAETREGVLGCRFLGEERIQYFLDMEDLICNCFRRRKAQQYAYTHR